MKTKRHGGARTKRTQTRKEAKKMMNKLIQKGFTPEELRRMSPYELRHPLKKPYLKTRKNENEKKKSSNNNNNSSRGSSNSNWTIVSSYSHIENLQR